MNSEPIPMYLQPKAAVATCPLLQLFAVWSMHTQGLDPYYPLDVDKLKDLADTLDDRAHRLVREDQQEALAMTERAQLYRALAAAKKDSTQTTIILLSKTLRGQR